MIPGESENITGLLDKYLANTATQHEEDTLMQMVTTGEFDQIIKQLIDAKFADDAVEYAVDANRSKIILENIFTQNKSNVISIKRSPTTWYRIAAAAIIFLMLSVGGYLYFKSSDTKPSLASDPKPASDIAAPANSKAMITLADGTTVPLDSLNSGTLATQGNTSITKTAQGQIIYTGFGSSPSGEEGVRYNTLTNPRGSQVVDITLADGSRVWLNAGSSVTYPVVFIGKERKVTITGEAYFEVAHNAAMPFVVQKNDISVQVLGTHFNVNTYDDEAHIKVTLLEGSVKVTNSQLATHNSLIIKPGQQAQLTNNAIKIEIADIKEVMGWKNGLFKYNDSDIGTVMRQISRWYNVTVSYPEGLPKERYGGSLRRDLSLASIFKVLEETGAHFVIEGKNVKVLP